MIGSIPAKEHSDFHRVSPEKIISSISFRKFKDFETGPAASAHPSHPEQNLSVCQPDLTRNCSQLDSDKKILPLCYKRIRNKFS